MHALRFASIVLIAVVVSRPSLAGAQMAPPNSQVAVDLRRDECTQVAIGTRVRFAFSMSFDPPIDHGTEMLNASFRRSAQDLAGRVPIGLDGTLLQLEQPTLRKLDLPDRWEYVGTVSRYAEAGKYRMTNFVVSFLIPGPNANVATTELSPEAKEEIQHYSLCLASGYTPSPIPKGQITDIASPRDERR